MGRSKLICLYFVVALSSPALAEAKKTTNGPSPFSGDARGFGGGDFLDPRLSMVRSDLLHSLKLVGSSPKELCRVSVCPIGLSTPLCDRAKLQEPQVAECRDFLSLVAAQVGAAPGLLSFEVTADELSVTEPDGRKRPVAARTALGPKGKIQIHRATALTLTPEDLTALVGHELGHKVVRDGKSPEDVGPVGTFASGKDFLDAVGAALAVFTAANRIPPQAPPSLTVSTDKFCAQPSPLLAGWAADMTGQTEKVPAAPAEEGEGARLEAARQWIQSETVRQYVLKTWFQSLFRRAPESEEAFALGIQLSQGANLSALYATMLRDPEYLNSRRIANDEGFVKSIYQDVLGRNPDARELARAFQDLKLHGKKDFLVVWLQENETVSAARIASWYRRYLNREPWQAETKVLGDQMKAGLEWEAVQASLLASSEYAALQKVRAKGCSGNRGLSSVGK